MTRGREPVVELAVVGDLTDQESDVTAKLLEVPCGGECVIYFDTPGGSPYSGMAIMSLLLLRDIAATAVVTGECSSAALWPLAACRRRLVTPFSVLLFHPMKWQSEENVGLLEAREWARHFGTLETDMDRLLAHLFRVEDQLIAQWMKPGRYVSGPEMVDAGMAELIELEPLSKLKSPGKAINEPRKPRRTSKESGKRSRG